eukprot:TRINITY_DN3341_c0_g1_i3.p1 TRINITY_DN3341_c0_g1~~TRINITY_DN3341_c0_g1_i3.p1  ORF type:complete len:772 (+),score=124.52 TRINITY_DN3341_c0_g1_i3:107-2317(+)
MYGEAGAAVKGKILNISEIKDSWAGVLQKASENKISVKNAWAVHSFDSLPVLAKKLGEDRDFHTSGVAIESAAKVFSYKVDALLLQSSKVQSAISRGDELKEDDETNAPADGNPENPAANRTKKRTKTLGPTLASKEELTIKSLEKQSEVDPLFAQTSSRFDQGGTRGLLVLNCPIGDKINIQIDSSSSDVFSGIKDAEEVTCRVGGRASFGAVSNATGRKSLQSVVGNSPITETPKTIEKEEEADNSKQGVSNSPDPEEGIFQATESLPEPALEPEPEAATEQPQPQEVLDLPVSQVFDSDDDEPPEDFPVRDEGPPTPPSETEKQSPTTAKPISSPVQMQADVTDYNEAVEQLKMLDTVQIKNGFSIAQGLLFDSSEEDEILHMRGAKRKGNWQGPYQTQRWKALRKTTAKGADDADVGAATERRKRRVKGLIDFGLSDDCMTDTELQSKFAEAPKPELLLLQRGRDRKRWEATRGDDDTFPEDFLKNETEHNLAAQNKLLLPTDHNITTAYFFKLFGIKWSMLDEVEPVKYSTQKKPLNQNLPLDMEQVPPPDIMAGEMDAADILMQDNASSPDDLFDDAPSLPDDDDVPMVGESVPRPNFAMDAALPLPTTDTPPEPPRYSTEVQVEVPKGVTVLKINHATKSRFINIKRLKDTMWEVLSEGTGRLTGDILFSDLIRKMRVIVPHRKIAAHVSEISVSLYFISLLHLCNDHGLKLVEVGPENCNVLITKNYE